MARSMKDFTNMFFNSWRFVLTMTLPFILFFLLFLESRNDCKVSKTVPPKADVVVGRGFEYLYLVLLMISQFFMAFPELGVIGFIPVALLPLLTVGSTKKVTGYYMQENNMAFLTTSTIGIALGCTQLQMRFVYQIMGLNGVDLISITLTVMWTTAILSAFLTASAAVMIMIPIALLVKQEVIQCLLNDNIANEGTSVPRKIYFKRKFTDPEIEGEGKGMVVEQDESAAKDMVEIDLNESDAEEMEQKGQQSEGVETDSEVGEIEEQDKMRPVTQAASNYDTRNSIFALAEFPSLVAQSPNELHPEDAKALKKFEESLLLTIAQAASIGAILFPYSTLVSDPLYYIRNECGECYANRKDLETQITLKTWLVYAFPVFIVLTGVISRIRVLMTFSLQSHQKFSWLKCGMREQDDKNKEPTGIIIANDPQIQDKIKAIMKEKYNQLGSFRFRECTVGIILILCAFLFFFRDPRFMDGWAVKLTERLPNNKLSSSFYVAYPHIIRISAVSTVFLVLFFIIPKDIKESFCSTKKNIHFVCEALISWKLIQNRVAWGLVLMIGASTALFVYAEFSLVNNMIAKMLVYLFSGWPHELILLLLLVVTSALSQLIGNVTVVGISIPVMIKTCCKWGISPTYYLMPITLTCILSFVFPVASIPNAILFSTDKVSWKRMMKVGLLSNAIAILVVYLNHITIGQFIFGYGTFNDHGVCLLDNTFKKVNGSKCISR